MWQLGIVVVAFALPVQGQSCSVTEFTAVGDVYTPFNDFGAAIAFDGDTLVVGAPDDEAGGTDTGAAYVFERIGGTWERQAKLIPSDATAHAAFGGSVALEGDTAFIAARYNAFFDGAVYVFTRTGSVWTERQKLEHRWQEGTQFGASVEVEDDVLVVSAPGVITFDPVAVGALDVYRLADSEWVLESELSVPGASLYQWVQVGLTSNRVSAAYHTTPPSVAVFEHVAGEWKLDEVLETDVLASSTALERDTLLVGFPGEARVDVYDLIKAGPGAHYWALTHSLSEAAPRFGQRIGLCGATAVIGAPSDPQGNAWVYRRAHAGDYSLIGTLEQKTVAYSRFGSAVAAASDGAFAVAAYDLWAKPGAAYVMGFVDLPSSYCTAKPNSLGCVASMAYEGLPSATSSSGFVVTAAPVRNKKLGLLLYGVDGTAAVPFRGGTLCVGSPVARTSPVSSRGNPPPFNDCSGELRIDLSSFASGALGGRPLAGLRVPGTEVAAQWWSRDPGASFDTGLSDALRFIVCN